MILAFAFFANSYLIALVALGAYSITRMHFIKKEEALLLQKYGNAYQDYKRKVTW
jgi:protein-S-isoprenylcysteine O-methyltransferase Ste14